MKKLSRTIVVGAAVVFLLAAASGINQGVRCEENLKSDPSVVATPKAEHPKAEHPSAEHPKAEQPQVEQPQAEQPQAEHPKAEHPEAEHPSSEHPQ